MLMHASPKVHWLAKSLCLDDMRQPSSQRTFALLYVFLSRRCSKVTVGFDSYPHVNLSRHHRFWLMLGDFDSGVESVQFADGRVSPIYSSPSNRRYSPSFAFTRHSSCDFLRCKHAFVWRRRRPNPTRILERENQESGAERRFVNC